ncbi:hypothetical protein GYA28_03070 [Candidatus Roizmanbacteria bacterium]|jgi:dTDP-4-amino-4,6-dideoxygalactose transaminase|nr:hypothetical protein [Candidatus Roizmanbacteria bacterium]
MISADFAPNENPGDAWLSFKLIFQPWRWTRQEELQRIKPKIFDFLGLKKTSGLNICFFLTARSALYYYLKSLSLPDESQVLVQGLTCEAVVLPIIEDKLKPVYVDIENKSFSMDLEDLKKKITGKTKVIILQHSFGITPFYRKEIIKLAREKRLFLIEDLAHGSNADFSFASDYERGAYLLSFGRSKSVSAVFGGAIVSKKEIRFNLPLPSNAFILSCLLYKPLSIIIKASYDIKVGKIIHWLIRRFKLIVPEITDKEKRGEYSHFFDKAFPSALAILLDRQLDGYEETKKRRSNSVKYYLDHLDKPFQMTLQPLMRYPLLVENRGEILKKMAEKHIYLGKWYDQVIAPNTLDLNKVKYKVGSCPNAEQISRQIINLPTNIDLESGRKILEILNGN